MARRSAARFTCACSRVAFGSEPAILVAAAEPAGPNLSLAERASRLFAGNDDAIAVFTPDGELVHATPHGKTQLAGKATLADLGYGIATDKIGDGASTLLVVRLSEFPQTIGLPASPDSPPDAEVDLAPIAQAMHAADTEQKKAAVAPPEPGPPGTERRHPLRFVWEIDSDGRFTIGSDEFLRLIGPKLAGSLGRPWNDIAAEYNLDPQGLVARAIASRDTWSGISIGWPVDGTDERLAVELAGLPAYDRDRKFRGYRGFGVCRDVARIETTLARKGDAPDRQINVGKTETRPALSVVRPAENVVPFRAAADVKPTILSPVERTAFRELATTLTARLKGADELARGQIANDLDETPAAGFPVSDRVAKAAANAGDSRLLAEQRAPLHEPSLKEERPILDRLPVGLLVHRHDSLIYANRAFLEWTGCETLADFSQAGGLDSLFIEPEQQSAEPSAAQGQVLRIAAHDGRSPIEGRLFNVPWDGSTAMALVLLNPDRGAGSASAAPADAETEQLRAILDVATDGVIILDAEGRILSSNESVDRLFGYQKYDLRGRPFEELFAPESERIARRYFDMLAADRAMRTDDGRELIGKRAKGALVPLIVIVTRIAEDPQKFGVVFRDMTHWKKSEEELVNARRQAEKASSAKSEFLAKISHEMRTPLNAIIGFSEVMMGERFGPVGNDRYRDYLKDINASGAHLVSLLNDLLDLSKIEAGKLDLTFERVDLNDLTQASVAIMQPQANRERIIIRTSLSPAQLRVLADPRSVRQIALNILSNSIKFTGAGGQVIVSTALSDTGEAILRVRDTGIGMSEKDIETALEPFRQLTTTTRNNGSKGTGLGLPLTKALTEANRARFSIKSAVNAGTLVEIVFPAARVVTD